MFLPFIFRCRIDFIAFALLALAACWWCRRLLLRQRPDLHPPRRVSALLLTCVLAGGLLAEWAGRQRRAAIDSLLSSFGTTYALELQHRGHARVRLDTPPDDPTYQALLAAQRDWLRANPHIADIYTFRADAAGRIRFIVDSETDYDRDGRFSGPHEQRTPLGEIYPDATPDFYAALRGESRVDTSFVPDRWGLWVSSLTPIYDASGRIEAAVGIDYDGIAWLAAVLGARAVALAGTAVVIGILLASSTVGLRLRAEIRDRRAAEAQLQRDKAALDTLSRAKTEFLSVMSHEIRTPLTAIMGFASMLDDTSLDATQRRYLRPILTATERLVGLINDMSDIPKLEKGKLVLEQVPFAVLGVVREAVDGMTARTLEKGLALHFHQNLPRDLTVLGDPVRLQQVLLHLLTNALKFTEQGALTVDADWQPSAAGRGQGELRLRVADTGIGIPRDDLGHLFELFAAVDASHRRSRAGSGIGLAICQRLVSLMGGRIEASSTPGRGSQFSVCLPCTRISGDTTGAASGPLGSILVVEDEPLHADLLKALLERHGYAVTLVPHAAAAVAACAEQRFTALFFDLDLSTGSALEAARPLRQLSAAGTQGPLIAVVDSARDSLERCAAAGIRNYVTKPVYMPAVQSTLEAALQGRPGGDPTAPLPLFDRPPA